MPSSRCKSVTSYKAECALQETDVIGEFESFEQMVVLEGSWAKARQLLAHPSLRPLRCVQLPRSTRSTFWCLPVSAISEERCYVHAVSFILFLAQD